LQALNELFLKDFFKIIRFLLKINQL
jgi:hypothetical protein